MRLPRDFRPQQVYGVTQRGNRGQWVYVDAEDFAKAVELMRRYAPRHGVKVHVWCLVHNHGHWVFEASSKESISNLMRDMQGPYSRYLNKKYAKEPWRLLGVLRGRKRGKKFSKYLRMGPVNWSPRFDAVHLDAKGLREFMRYAELNPVRAGLVKRAERWKWSSAAAHFAGSDAEGLLCLEQWSHFFGNPETAAADWQAYVEGPVEEEAANRARLLVLRANAPYNRPTRWVAPAPVAVMSVGAASPPT